MARSAEMTQETGDRKEKCASPCDLKDKTREKYDVQWEGQDERAAANRRKNLSVVADPIIRMAMPFSGKVVADLGIGTGSLAFRAMELSPPKEMIGVDFSRPGLRVARRTSKHSGFRDMDVELVQADLERLPLTNKSVDIVLSQATINLLPSKCVALREIARVSRPGAKVAISDAFRTTKPDEDEPWEQCVAGAVTVGEFTELAMDAGLLVTNHIDMTHQVRALVAAKKWDWQEFIEHNLDYRGFLLVRG